MIQVTRLPSSVKLDYGSKDVLQLPDSPTARALLAYLWVALFGLSQREAAELERAAAIYVTAIAGLSPEQQMQVVRGELTISSIVNHRRSNGGCPGLAELLQNSTPAERLEAATAVGVKLIWDEMVEPLLDGDHTIPPARAAE